MNDLSTPVTDKRPFKGKGAEAWLSKVTREHEKIVNEMRVLSFESRQLNGSNWYLYLHHRKLTGRWFLMWRSVGVNDKKHVHLTWDKVEPHLRGMTEERAAWYREANELINLLNAQEKVTRGAMRMAEGLMKGE